MTNEKATEIIKSECYVANLLDLEMTVNINIALDMAIKALEQTSHLTDRPCSVCEYHTENGCSKWSCVFEEDKNDTLAESNE